MDTVGNVGLVSRVIGVSRNGNVMEMVNGRLGRMMVGVRYGILNLMVWNRRMGRCWCRLRVRVRIIVWMIRGNMRTAWITTRANDVRTPSMAVWTSRCRGERTLDRSRLRLDRQRYTWWHKTASSIFNLRVDGLMACGEGRGVLLLLLMSRLWTLWLNGTGPGGNRPLVGFRVI